jgi:hypothetical protein
MTRDKNLFVNDLAQREVLYNILKDSKKTASAKRIISL